ncbi:MAG: hypothetical protein WD231_03945 [Candidatus Woykebacteria bacterium]
MLHRKWDQEDGPIDGASDGEIRERFTTVFERATGRRSVVATCSGNLDQLFKLGTTLDDATIMTIGKIDACRLWALTEAELQEFIDQTEGSVTVHNLAATTAPA